MSRRFLRTAEVAAAVGVHPNTVRMYEAWGLLQEIPRTPAGYRQFTQAHVDQMRLARKAYEGQWPGRPIHQAAVALVMQAVEVQCAAADLDGLIDGLNRGVLLAKGHLRDPLEAPSRGEILPHRLELVGVSLFVTIGLMPAASARPQVSLMRATV